jgi:hypothetical protein
MFARLYQFGHQSCPAGLVRSTDTTPVTAMEVLVEQNLFAEVRVVVKFVIAYENRAASIRIFAKQLCQS